MATNRLTGILKEMAEIKKKMAKIEKEAKKEFASLHAKEDEAQVAKLKSKIMG